MQNKLYKTETLAEFIARGGKVTKCPSKVGRRKAAPRIVVDEPIGTLDLSALPMALKIRFGIR